MFTTKTDAIESIAQAIENGDASRDEFDLEQIADAAFEYSAELGGFVQTVDETGFWAAVQAAAK